MFYHSTRVANADLYKLQLRRTVVSTVPFEWARWTPTSNQKEYRACQDAARACLHACHEGREGTCARKDVREGQGGAKGADARKVLRAGGIDWCAMRRGSGRTREMDGVRQDAQNVANEGDARKKRADVHDVRRTCHCHTATLPHSHTPALEWPSAWQI